MSRPAWAPADVDPGKPSVARVYDYYLGGSHNFAADREFAERVLTAAPLTRALARDNREFLRRAVQYLVGEGVDQFLDLGSGIPTVGNVHEIAQETNPASTVVYVDVDPVAVTHGVTLLEDNPRAATIAGDVRHTDQVLADVARTGLLDLDRPVAVMIVAVLHFIHDHDEPARFIASYFDAVPDGSYLVLSHARGDAGPPAGKDVEATYQRNDTPGRLRLRTAAEIEALFGDLHFVPPGLVELPAWRPTPHDPPAALTSDYPGLAGVARKV